ncbi:DUF4178 domain-containing protein [Dyadobacter sp. CY261]|uniref:DUF4178 domain-containing protein n=1 Tax=Dyadobacter sp. CY261 TaxID=2907203 RepID=UPI001F379061|nr:DUF4178 domain-containing protein [Dyadobacter sp. CY261]MCF0069414.1 DUF4178 domain-containing protein [Dyadobacter sp. CY261]
MSIGTSKLAICPSCGKPVYFQGSNNLAACACQKVWYRQGDELVPVPMRMLHAPTDIIQPGTTGRWKDVAFTVTGRIRVHFEDNVFNYWTLNCNDGVTRHLAEGYGMYAVCEVLPFKEAVIARKFRSDAQKLRLPDDREFWVTARNEHRLIEVEGNAFVPDLPDRFISIEGSSDSERVELVAYAEDVAVVFACHDIVPEMLFLGNTRDVEPAGRRFSCQNCAATNNVLTYPYAQSWVCNKCETRHSFTGEDYATHGGQHTSSQNFSFTIGERITLEGGNYQFVGMVQKYDIDSRADYWQEYTLFSKLHGFAFLTESDGHWTILKETKNAPAPSDARMHQIDFDNQSFRRFSKYHFRILYALGEFPGNVFSMHEETEAMDYIAPPEILSIEKDYRKRISWFRGKYIRRKVIASQVSQTLPRQVGIAPAQPSWVNMKTESIAKSGIVALLLVVLVQMLTGSSHTNRVIFSSTYVFSDSLNTQTFITEKFELEKWSSALDLDFSSPVENSWLELNATLVNAVDGSEYSMQKGVEFYSGYESGEHWSEGDHDGVIHFTKIPAGTYFLKLTAARDSNMYSQVSVVSAKLIHDAISYRNMWIVMLLALVWPLTLGLSRYYSENTRWGNSPFSNF